MARKILVVEDDHNISDLIRMYLEKEGFEVFAAFDGGKAVELFRSVEPNIVLLDIMLPVMDGWSVCAKIRETSRTPIIMITAKSEVFDRIQGLEMGADDYIVKPFGMSELIARVRARLRRIAPKANEDILTIGAITLDKRGHTVRINGESIALTIKEYDLLCLLMENQGMAFSREQLLDKVWDYGYDGGTRTVDVHIQTLRAKLGDSSRMIETVRGIGYRFGGK